MRMLKDNIKALRKSKGMTQEELAVRLNVVRQTVSKWEKGLSVPDSDMLISLSEVFETPVSELLGESTAEPNTDELQALCDRLDTVALQLVRSRRRQRTLLHWLFISLCGMIIIAFICLAALKSPYLGWDYSDPERSVAGVALHAFEWFFVRLSPFALAGAVVGAFLTRKKE